ncbi:hypothetical protein [Amycolatopsis sp. H20-H5]|uniref:hypothetical protein n=1 Tax=Amycolatopsis sp. H20-H5 TaxID=3046309 RepID=UPI002DB6E66F|nr:hypothetical protein [Amycolatopsis sp. H20-H5]MEC3980856.1 hypothetical protein [Amycolatopsis sp. H20-H5]
MSIGDVFGHGQGYRVYPEKLREAANGVGHAADLTQAFADTDLADTMLAGDDLGLPGTATIIMPGLRGVGTVERYNNAIHQIIELTRVNATELRNLGDALRKAAEYYEQLDEEAYEKLKKIEGGMK